MKDFWIACGHHLLDRDANGRLVLTDEFLKAYFARPELMPPADACEVERRLHRQVLADPRVPVSSSAVAAIADPDARDNWRLVLAFRDLLLRHATLEAAYRALVCSGSSNVPPLFLNQLVHVILRNALDGCDDPFVLRAGELFFRPQRVFPHEHSLLLGDEEAMGGSSPTPVLSLISLLGDGWNAQEILSDENADNYWRRSDHFDFALDLTAGTKGPAALAQAMRRWIFHLLGLDVAIEPLTALREAKLTWYVGLDTEATRIGNRLWRGEALGDHAVGRVVALFRLSFHDPGLVFSQVGREPVYLILGMTSDRSVRMKPQNLLMGLPIKSLEATT